MLKKFLITIILFVSTTVLADFDGLKYCPKGTKDPQCWEGHADPKDPGSKYFYICKDMITYGKIESAVWDNNIFKCKIGNEGNVDCTFLVEKLGSSDIVGEWVQVVTSRVDLCHLEGACGKHSCKSIGKYARLAFKTCNRYDHLGCPDSN